MKPELKEQVSRLEKQEEDFLAGTATLCLHCPFCTEELLGCPGAPLAGG